MGSSRSKTTAVRRRAGALAVLGFFAAVAGATAERHALLLGIGDYPAGLRRLDGPRHDVEALRDELVDSWGFAPRNVQVLLDEEATRTEILARLDHLARVSRPGDDVFLYYSGHGTSAFDEELAVDTSRLSRWTGALVPYDAALDLPSDPGPEEWLQRLIVGHRDLQPRLLRLDRDRNVFVVFDTCFSGETVRSISKWNARWVDPPVHRSFTDAAASLSETAYSGPPADPVVAFGRQERPGFPYRRLIYLAAARRFERADEVPSWRTGDGRPHGALTDALLLALDGRADGNRDGRLSYRELYGYVRDRVSERHLQMPQLLYPEDDTALVEGPVFSHHGQLSPANAAAAEPGGLAVWIAPELAALRPAVAGIAGARLVERGEDVRIVLDADGRAALEHPSGDCLAEGFDVRSPRRLIERLRRQVEVQALIDLTYPREDLSLSLELLGNRGFLVGQERFEIAARAGAPAVLVLLNIDKTGTVSVLHPIRAGELGPRPGLVETFEAIPPYGTEYLKLFAFREPPERLAAWVNQRVDVLDPGFGELLQVLAEAKSPRGETRLRIVTVGELMD